MFNWLTRLAEAGVDIFYCSQRRFWEPEFECKNPESNFAGWVKKLTGQAIIAVGSVGLSGEFMAGFASEASVPNLQSLDELLRCLDRGNFDLMAIGRSLIVDPDWVEKSNRAAPTS